MNKGNKLSKILKKFCMILSWVFGLGFTISSIYAEVQMISLPRWKAYGNVSIWISPVIFFILFALSYILYKWDDFK